MARQGGKKAVTPDDVLDRLWELEQTMGLGSRAEFARQIGKDPDSISPQQLWNWKNGRDRISLETLLLLKPSVRALLLLERAEDAEIFAEGKHAGLLAAKQAIDKEINRLLARGADAKELGRELSRSRQQLEAALAEEQTGRAGRKQQAGTRRPSRQ